ncbi:DNA polymerase I, partial [Candidatus Dojkabacteria bacterium]
NYSIIYGVSSYGLSESLRIDKHMANNLIQKFYENYPNIKKYFNAQTEDLYKKNFLETALGRKRKVTDFKKVNKFAQQAIIRELLNFPIQGTAADLMKEAMIKIDKILQEYDAKLLLQIHDEFLFEFKGSNFEKNDFITKIKEAMESVTNLGVTYKVDVQIGKRWGEMQ